MTVMKLFHAVRTYFRTMGFYAEAQPNQTCEFNQRNLFFILTLAGMSIPIAGHIILKENSVAVYSAACYELLTITALLIYFAVIFCHMGNIQHLIEKFEKFIENRMEYKPMSTILYTELNDKIESASEWSLFILVKTVFAGTVLPLLYVCSMNFYVYDLGEDSFYLPWPMLLPFDWRTPFGYLVTLAAEYTSINSAVFGFTPIISFFIGSGWFAIWIVKDITSDLAALKDQQVSTKRRQKELKKKFYYIVRFYSDAREFVDEFSKIYEFILTTLFIWSLLSICVSLLKFLAQLVKCISSLISRTFPHFTQTSLHLDEENVISSREIVHFVKSHSFAADFKSEPTSHPVELIYTLMLMETSFFAIFFFCEFGEMISSQFIVFDEEVCQCNWYEFPIDVQRVFIIFMSWTQRVPIVQGYGNTKCTRDAFKSTIKGGFSYFITLRRMNA